MSQDSAIEVALQWNPLKNGLPHHQTEQFKKVDRELLVQIFIPFELISDIISVSQHEDASRIVKHFLKDHMYPLSEQTPSVIDFLAKKLNFNFLMHIDLFGLYKAAHEDIAPF